MATIISLAAARARKTMHAAEARGDLYAALEALITRCAVLVPDADLEEWQESVQEIYRAHNHGLVDFVERRFAWMRTYHARLERERAEPLATARAAPRRRRAR